jgi:general secretion pathway protein G
MCCEFSLRDSAAAIAVLRLRSKNILGARRDKMKANKQSGFTLLEIMLVVILISILAAIVIPRFVVSSKRAKVQSCEMNRSIINSQVETYYFSESTWPLDSMNDIRTNVNYFPDGIPTCPIDQTSYVLVPSPVHRVSGHREGDGTHVF